MALPANAPIHTLAGPVSVSEFAAMCSADPQALLHVFTWTGAQITVGVARGCRPVGEEQIFEVHLDDGAILYTSTGTEFLLRNGGLKRPPEITIGESLMPLYLAKDKHGYPVYKENGDAWKRAIAPADRTCRRKVARMVAEWKEGRALPRGTYVEHIDGNRENYRPDNLRIVHKPSKALRSTVYDVVTAVKLGQSVIRQVEGIMPKRRPPNNHAVRDVRPMEIALTYEFIVEPTGVFAMQGVFIGTGD